MVVEALDDKKKYAFSAKSNAAKEIEAWGQDYASLTDPAMRSAGQLTDNVTEARLLQTKVMDMSRDRYKYITQADYKKKFFIKKQQAKTKIMPHLLQGVDIDLWMSKKAEHYVPQLSSSNARFAFLDRFENTGEKCKEFEENPFAIPEPVRIINQPLLPEFYRIRLMEEQEEAQKKATVFPTQPILARSAVQKSVTFCKNSDIKLPSVTTASAKSMPLFSRSHSTVNSPTREPKPPVRRAQSGPTSQSRSVEDRRYRNLESTLTIQQGMRVIDTSIVPSIIGQLDALHVPSKSTTSGQPKVQKKILEHLRAKGIID